MFRTTLLTIASISSLTFTSCDSGDVTQIDGTAQATTNAIANPGDRFLFAPLVTIDTTAGEVPITSTNTSSVSPFINYIYTKTGNHTAKFDYTANTPALLENALELTLSGAFGVPLSTELRFILSELRSPDGVFTDVDIARIVAILNIAGSGLNVNPDNPNEILASNNRVYNMLATSNVEEKFRGTIGGNYNVVGSGFVVRFREVVLPGGQDNTPVHLPFVSTLTFDPIELEKGRWTQELRNVTDIP